MPNSKPVIIITGAGGFVGAALAQHCARQGWEVRALVRNSQHYKSTKNLRYYEYDLTEPFDTAVFVGADYLFHAAYVKQNRQNPHAKQVNITATKRLLAASRTYKLKRNVFMSSMSAHSQATSVYGKQKLAIEKLFSANTDIVIRSGLIIGNGGIVKNMAAFMKSKHAVPLIGGGQQPLQIIGLYDLIHVIEVVLSSKLYGTYTVATTQIYTYKTFYKKLAEQLGIRIVFIPLPYDMLLLAMKLISRSPLPLSVNEENLLGLKNLRAADNANDLQKLGVHIDSLETVLRHTGILPGN